MQDYDYNSVHQPHFQVDPPLFTENKKYEDGWTDTIRGYHSEAGRLVKTLKRNAQLKGIETYQHWIINPMIHQDEDEVNEYWQRFRKAWAKTKIPFFQTLEVTEANIVHTHILLETSEAEDTIEAMLTAALPTGDKRQPNIKRGDDQYLLHLFLYVTKAKVRGKSGTRLADDKFRDKRLLFRKNLPFRKLYYSRSFWARPLKDIRSEFKVERDTIESAKRERWIEDLVAHLHGLIGEAMTYDQVFRHIALCKDKTDIDAWIYRDMERRERRNQMRPHVTSLREKVNGKWTMAVTP